MVRTAPKRRRRRPTKGAMTNTPSPPAAEFSPIVNGS